LPSNFRSSEIFFVLGISFSSFEIGLARDRKCLKTPRQAEAPTAILC
jgi:hypothetical protein